MKKLILIDGNSILFRAYYATAYPGATLMQTSKGEYTNAIFAFSNMFTKIINEEDIYALVAFDTSSKTFRHEEYLEYKAGRKEMPKELLEQLPRIDEYIELYGVKAYRKSGYEADDIIGIYSKIASEKGIKVEIYSSDRDLLQLVNENTTVHLLKKGMQDVRDYTPSLLIEEFNLNYNQMIDLKALMGDPSDNIPGVLGIGEKTAIKLLEEYETLENIYLNIDKIKGKLQEKLILGKESAFLSKRLVTIMREGNLDFEVEDLKKEPILEKELSNFLQKYELHSLVKQMNISNNHDLLDYSVISSSNQLEKILKDKCAIYFEFSDDNYHTADLWGIGLYDGKSGYFIDSKLVTDEIFKEYIESSKIEKYTYNYKAAAVSLLWKEIKFKNCGFDLLLAAYLVDSHYGKDEFKYVVSNFDYNAVNYDEQVYGKGAKKGLPKDESLYQKHIVSKAKAIYDLREKIVNKLEETEQLHLLNDVEIPLSKVLAKMEYNGILVDKNELLNQENEIAEKIKELTKDIIELAGRDFNIASPKQLGEVLFEDLKLPHAKKNKTGYQTNVEVLNKLKNEHPIINKISEFRELNKLYTTYILGLKQVIFPDGKIHTIYKQALTTTGRLSSVEPNLQNIPTRTLVGKNIRKIFIAENDKFLLGSDYSQIELRVLASIANVNKLKEAFHKNLDIHTQTAKEVFEIDGEVTSEQRRAAKAVNFGIIYGISAWSLADDLEISVKDAQDFINKYFHIYPEIKKYMEDTVSFAVANGYVETLDKRRRYINELSSKVFMVKEFGKRTAMNAPIQGTAADILKIAMIKLHKYLEENNKKSKILLQVHDELILEVPSDEVENMKEVVPKIMKESYRLSVDLDTSCDIGKTWYDI